MNLSDKLLQVTIVRTPRGGWSGYVDTIPGKCFDDGSHVRALHWYDGKKSEFKKSLAVTVADVNVVDCDEPECDHCNECEE